METCTNAFCVRRGFQLRLSSRLANTHILVLYDRGEKGNYQLKNLVDLLSAGADIFTRIWIETDHWCKTFLRSLIATPTTYATHHGAKYFWKRALSKLGQTQPVCMQNMRGAGESSYDSMELPRVQWSATSKKGRCHRFVCGGKEYTTTKVRMICNRR